MLLSFLCVDIKVPAINVNNTHYIITNYSRIIKNNNIKHIHAIDRN